MPGVTRRFSGNPRPEYSVSAAAVQACFPAVKKPSNSLPFFAGTPVL
jgi:hypothetical protein